MIRAKILFFCFAAKKSVKKLIFLFFENLYFVLNSFWKIEKLFFGRFTLTPSPIALKAPVYRGSEV